MSKEHLIDPGGVRETLVKQKTREILGNFLKDISEISPKKNPLKEETTPKSKNKTHFRQPLE